MVPTIAIRVFFLFLDSSFNGSAQDCHTTPGLLRGNEPGNKARIDSLCETLTCKITCHFRPCVKNCKVKQGNLERKLDFGICCSRKFHSKSEMMFVWEAHLSTIKASKSCLTLLLYLGCTAD